MKVIKHTFLSVLLLPVYFLAAQSDPFLTKQYDALHDSPMQQKFRAIAPMPAGVVYVQQPGEGEAEMRAHFRNMKRLGFNALKQIMARPDWTIEKIAYIALDEDIIPWWYGEGGFELPDGALLKLLGIAATLPMSEILQHPAMQAHQKEVLRRRIEKIEAYTQQAPDKKFMRVTSVAFDPEIGGRGAELTPKGETLFLAWLKQKYGTIEQLNQGWNQYHAGLSLHEARVFTDWDDLAKNWRGVPGREYNHVKDIYRFKVDYNTGRIVESARTFNAFDPNAPYRGGGELAVFHSFAWYSVDMERVANALTDYGSFYPSMHFAWHYNLSKGEVNRSLYMQASLMHDLNKGGWTGGWESTGGPQQHDGEKNAGHDNSYYVGPGELKKLYLSQLAAGFKGFGIWCWNARSAGKEGGEYSLLDRNGQITDRAVEMGKLSQALQRYRTELWAAHKEPAVGVLYDWENEATWAAMSISGRDDFRLQPVRARIGISDLLIKNNVPFEYVTPADLAKGLAGRYRVIYLPAILSLRRELLPIFKQYVENGGHLVLDLPSAWYDEHTVNLPTGRASAFEQLFGISLDDFQYAGTNHQQTIGQQPVDGFTMQATLTKAQALHTYDNGRPAITEHALGKGRAIVLGFQASLNAFGSFTGERPAHPALEALTLARITDGLTLPYRCQQAAVYRLAAPQADHYVLLNQGEAQTATLVFQGKKYRNIINAITGEPINPNNIALPKNDALWLRAEN
jgi:beta-galactosidase